MLRSFQARPSNTTIHALLALVLVAATTATIGCSPGDGKKEGGTAAPSAAPASGNPVITMKTSKGDIEIELFADKAPLSVKNFLQYADSGHYDGTIFHRTIEKFMIQGGGFTADGMQKPNGPPVKNEATNGLKNERGTVAMARTSVVDSATSQFFINHADNTSLDHKAPTQSGFGYAVFGKVLSGMDVVDKIATAPTSNKGGAFANRPNEDVVILSVKKKGLSQATASRKMRIASLLARREPVFSFEFFPPKTEAGDRALLATLSELRGLSPDYVSVTYGAGGTTRDRTVELVSYIKNDLGLEAMAHLTCVGASREELGLVLDRLEKVGIENVIALRGDPPVGEDSFVPHPEGLAYACQLVELIREQKRPFCVAGACYPEKHIEAVSFDDDLSQLAGKVRAGIDFLITQLFFDNRSYFDFVTQARAAGITVPIVAGIMPITNLGQIERFTKRCGAIIPDELHAILDPHREDSDTVEKLSVDWAVAQCRELIEAGVPGVHFYTLNKSRATRDILIQLRK